MPPPPQNPPGDDSSPKKYSSVVVDSGAIIKLTSSSLLRVSSKFYTTKSVIDEIRDSKAREHLRNLPFELLTREPSSTSCRAVAGFARLTGDYRSLSTVDLEVLGLQYELEVEGCGGGEHLRKEPKRRLGGGRIVPLKVVAEKEGEKKGDVSESVEQVGEGTSTNSNGMFVVEVEEEGEEGEDSDSDSSDSDSEVPKTWATMVEPSSFGSMKISDNIGQENVDLGGQFSDAEEDSDEEEEGGIYILDPVEVEAKKRLQSQPKNNNPNRKELESNFPTLLDAASNVKLTLSSLEISKEEEQKRALASLQPILTQEGKQYNTLGRYKKPLAASAGVGNVKLNAAETKRLKEHQRLQTLSEQTDPASSSTFAPRDNASRIMGGKDLAGQSADVLDDGEGWVTMGNIATVKASGGGFSFSDNHQNNQQKSRTSKEAEGPPVSSRCACATTDFAMQNVILQMGMNLVSVDGVVLKKLKHWVTRCSACFTVYGTDQNKEKNGKSSTRLFCEKCGSNALQRVAASVNAKTGRYRLHLRKNYKFNLRGTKYSLPKPGKGNRFEGDLLLREDQLMMGAWNQKVKRGQKKVESIFGSDIISNVGLGDLTKRSDIKVGFGRQNPNSARSGRERRGKKKKTTEKACGLRRY